MPSRAIGLTALLRSPRLTRLSESMTPRVLNSSSGGVDVCVCEWEKAGFKAEGRGGRDRDRQDAPAEDERAAVAAAALAVSDDHYEVPTLRN